MHHTAQGWDGLPSSVATLGQGSVIFTNPESGCIKRIPIVLDIILACLGSGIVLKPAEDRAHSKTLREVFGRAIIRQVLECAQSSAAFAFPSNWQDSISPLIATRITISVNQRRLAAKQSPPFSQFPPVRIRAHVVLIPSIPI